MTRTYLSLQVIKNVALPDRSPSLKGCDIERGLCQCCRLPPAPKDAGFRLAIIIKNKENTRAFRRGMNPTL